jgi:hypothetical protein
MDDAIKISLKPKSEELMRVLANSATIIEAVETEDELGTILRLHMYLETMLSLYLSEMLSDEETAFIGKMQMFSNKLNFAVSCHLPIPYAEVFSKVNEIRNKSAHRINHSLNPAEVKELAKLVNGLSAFNMELKPIETQYIGIAKFGEDHKAKYGENVRFDFIMCCLTLHKEVMPFFIRTFAATHGVFLAKV